MSNTNGLTTLKTNKFDGLLKSLQVQPKEDVQEEHGIELSKEVISWGAQLAAEIVKKTKEENKGKGVGAVLKVLWSFVDDLVNAAPIISKFDQLKKEIEDWSTIEGGALEDWLNVETKRAFEEKGLSVNNNSSKLVLKIVGLVIHIVAVHDELA